MFSAECNCDDYVEGKFSHTRFRALGLELIPVDKQSSRGCRMPLLSARSEVTYSAEKRDRPSTGTKLYCLVTEAH